MGLKAIDNNMIDNNAIQTLSDKTSIIKVKHHKTLKRAQC